MTDSDDEDDEDAGDSKISSVSEAESVAAPALVVNTKQKKNGPNTRKHRYGSGMPLSIIFF